MDCNDSYNAGGCKYKTNATKGEAWSEIEGYGTQATLTQYIKYSIEDSTDLGKNASYNIFLFMKREDAVLDAADTAKTTGVTVHRIGILHTPEGDYTGIFHDVATNVSATQLPDVYSKNYDFRLDHHGQPHGYTDDFREHEFWPTRGEMNMHGGAREGFIVDLAKSKINGRSYEVTLRRTIEDPAEAAKIVNKGMTIKAAVDHRRYKTAEGTAKEDLYIDIKFPKF